MTDEELADLLAGLPEEVRLVGGPFCGMLLHPQHECIHRPDEGEYDGYAGLVMPDSWAPLGLNCLSMNRGRERWLYVMESESRWRFLSFQEAPEEPPL
jgi:hypothetical protein